MENALISVIIPAYNAEEHIERCLDSVKTQTYSNLEILVIDDGSTDNTLQICENHSKSDNRIIVIHQSNSGVANTRNLGLDSCHGEYVTFIDSDDYVCDDFIEILYKHIILNPTPAVRCNYFTKIENKLTEYKYYDESEIESSIVLKDLLYQRKNLCYCWGVLFKRSAIGDIRFKNYLLCEDTHFLVDFLVSQNTKIGFVNKALYVYVCTPTSITHSKEPIVYYDSCLVAEDIINTLSSSHEYKSFIPAANNLYITYTIYAYIKIYSINNSDEYLNKIKKMIKSLRSMVIKDRQAPLVTRLACLLTFISFDLMVLVYNIYKRCFS